MNTKSKYLPDGFHAVTPYLTVKNPKEAIAFYKRAFGARERVVMPMPDGQIAHAEIQIADSIIMLGCECPEHGGVSAQTLGDSPVSLVRGERRRCFQPRHRRRSQIQRTY